MIINNPILSGFNPDPSFICVGDDFYIATSTFEYYPGVEIHHSKDLVNWEVISRPLNTLEHLDLGGNPPAGGIWAPNLTYKDGFFYLIFTDVCFHTPRPFKDTHNFISKATDIKGPWSKPIYLHSDGFDPALFHDEGASYLINMEWDYRGPNHFAGINLQRIDLNTFEIIGPVHKIFQGTDLKVTEGPNLYKTNGYYYLFVAEGGTGYTHATSVARSRMLTGPYEVHPSNPLMNSGANSTLQKAGHASICQTPNGKWYLAHLCSRPIHQRSILGRETALQNLVWRNEWPYLANGTNHPSESFEVDLNTSIYKTDHTHYTFHNDQFLTDMMMLRIPFQETIFSIKERPGYLRIHGKESLVSRFEQSILIRKQEDFCFSAEIGMEFEPKNYKQLAGLIYRYNENNQYFLYMTFNEKTNQNELSILKIDQGEVEFYKPLSYQSNTIYFRINVNYLVGQFLYSHDGVSFSEFGPAIDCSILSDEYAQGYTGAVVGMACLDMYNQSGYADFSYFSYKRLK